MRGAGKIDPRAIPAPSCRRRPGHPRAAFVAAKKGVDLRRHDEVGIGGEPIIPAAWYQPFVVIPVCQQFFDAACIVSGPRFTDRPGRTPAGLEAPGSSLFRCRGQLRRLAWNKHSRGIAIVQEHTPTAGAWARGGCHRAEGPVYMGRLRPAELGTMGTMRGAVRPKSSVSTADHDEIIIGSSILGCCGPEGPMDDTVCAAAALVITAATAAAISQILTMSCSPKCQPAELGGISSAAMWVSQERGGSLGNYSVNARWMGLWRRATSAG